MPDEKCTPEISLYCKTQFDEIKEDLKTVKAAIVGNGTVGYNVRIDRLEQARKARSKLEWMVIGCLTVVLVNSAWSLVGKVIVTLSTLPKP